MKKMMFLFAMITLGLGMNSCDKILNKKSKGAKLFESDWVNKNPEKFSYSMGTSLTVGAQEIQQEILEISFKGGTISGGYSGQAGSGITTEKIYSENGDSSYTSNNDWGQWEYKNREDKLQKTGGNVFNFPADAEGQEVIGELWSNTKNGAIRFFVLKVDKKELKVVFKYMNSAPGASSSQSNYYYSPVMTFVKK